MGFFFYIFSPLVSSHIEIEPNKTLAHIPGFWLIIKFLFWLPFYRQIFVQKTLEKLSAKQENEVKNIQSHFSIFMA